MEIPYDGIIVIDNKGVITMANQAAVDFFHKPVEMVVGKSVEKVLENSRLYQVVKTGVAELHQLQFIGGLKEADGNKAEAARILGISRSWLFI